MKFDDKHAKPGESQPIDAGVAIGIGVALTALRSIASGNGSLRKDGEVVTGTLKEFGRAITVSVTQTSFALDGQEVLSDTARRPSERLKDVSSRIFELASMVAAGANQESEDFAILGQEINGYVHDQSLIGVHLPVVGTMNRVEEPECVDYEATIRRLTPLFVEETKVTSGMLTALTDAFDACNQDLFVHNLEIADERYHRHLDRDLSADSRWGSSYLAHARHVVTHGDMERLVHFNLRHGLAQTLFSLHCESYGERRQLEKRQLEDLLVKVFIGESSKSEEVAFVVRPDSMLENVAVAELSLAAFKVLRVGFDPSLYNCKPLGKLTHDLYFHALEGASGLLTKDAAIVEGLNTGRKIATSSEFQGLQDYAFARYLGDVDLQQVSSLSTTATLGNKCARSYRNACVQAVEEVERLEPERFIDIHRDERTRQDGTIVPFSEFIERRGNKHA